ASIGHQCGDADVLPGHQHPERREVDRRRLRDAGSRCSPAPGGRYRRTISGNRVAKRPGSGHRQDGEPERMSIREIVETWEGRPTFAVIDLDALATNVQTLRQH